MAQRRRARGGARLPGELVFRDEMRRTPPHILLTNYSMLEYLLIRPDDSPLFDGGRGAHWQFIVLDEAHQYRGARGMEMGMLIRRLKQRLRDGGRRGPFRCIATSATITSGQGDEDRQAVAGFAEELFGEPFSAPTIVFGESLLTADDGPPRRFHAFLRALEGAFLVHREGVDAVVLNRKSESGDGFGRRASGDRALPRVRPALLCRPEAWGEAEERPSAIRAIRASASTTICRTTTGTNCCAGVAVPCQRPRPAAAAALQYASRSAPRTNRIGTS